MALLSLPLVCAVAVLGVLCYVICARPRAGQRLPPGPPTLPFIGNLHQIPKTGAHRLFTKWAKIYGGIFTLYFGQSPVIIITDRRLVRELVDKKSLIYSDRPPLFVTQDLITKGDHLSVMRYSDRWRAFRKIVHQHVTRSKIEKDHIQLVEAEETQMMRDFLVRPEDHMLHPKRTSNSVIMSIAYGIRSESYQAPHTVELYDMMERFSDLLEPGALPPVDIFPVLKLFPEFWFGNWIQRCLDIRARMKRLYSGVLTRAIRRRAAHGSRDSAIDYVLARQEKMQLTQNQLEFIGGVFQEGGSETISSTMLVVIQALALNPDIQARAHTQIDAVCSEDRPPQWSDYEKLPYVSMIVKEAFRWRPIAPLAFPHALTQDDYIDGMFLPKGAVVFINVWGLHHDEPRFPDPDKFDPSRFEGRTKLAADYAASPDYMDRDHYGYGAGRRICPGIHLAEREMFLGIAKLLWAFDFAQNLDSLGNPIPIDTDPATGYSEGILVSPRAYECAITPRSDARAETILREFEKAEREVFSKFRD